MKLSNKIILCFILLLLGYIIVKNFAFQRIEITDNDMSPVFRKGDVVWVNKLDLGPRFPQTIFTLPFSKDKIYSSIVELPYWRLGSLKSIKQDDIIAYNYPNKFDLHTDRKPIKIHRCYGLPGDTIIVKKKQIYSGNKKLDTNITLNLTYRVTCTSDTFPNNIVEKYKLQNVRFVAHPGVFDVLVSNKKADSLNSEHKILYVRLLHKLKQQMSYVIYPNNRYYSWNSDSWGPIVVPEKGMTISLTFKNYYKYRYIFDVYEGVDVSIDGEKILINSREIQNYTFKNNYYLVFGDNREIARDSRYFGFVPEDHIIGTIRY